MAIDACVKLPPPYFFFYKNLLPMSNLALPPRPSKPLDHPVLPSDPEAGPSTGANVAIPPQRNLLQPDV